MTYENRTENRLCIYIRLHRREKKYMSKLKTLLRSIYIIIFSLSNMKQIFIEMISLMKRASKMKRLSGEEKKRFVMLELARIIPYDNAFEEILLDVIDLLIEVENGTLTINKDVKDNAVRCFDFMSCKK